MTSIFPKSQKAETIEHLQADKERSHSSKPVNTIAITIAIPIALANARAVSLHICSMSANAWEPGMACSRSQLAHVCAHTPSIENTTHTSIVNRSHDHHKKKYFISLCLHMPVCAYTFVMVGLAQDTHISLWPSSYSLQAWPRLQLAMVWQEIRRWQRISLFCPHIASNKAGSCKILAAGCTTNGNLPAQGMGPPQPPLRDTAVASYKAIALLLRPMVPRTLTSGRHDLPDNSLVIHCQVVMASQGL